MNKNLKTHEVYDFEDGRGPVPAHRHLNPNGKYGGWVEDSASVSGSVYLDYTVTVFGNANIFNEVTVMGLVKISGQAIICDGVEIEGDIEISGNVKLCNEVILEGCQKLDGNILICGSKKHE